MFYEKNDFPTLQKMKRTATVTRYGQISPRTYNIVLIPVENVLSKNDSRVLVAITIVSYLLSNVTD